VSHGERTYDRNEESFPRSECANRDAQIAVIVRAWPAADKSGEIATNGFICVNFHRDLLRKSSVGQRQSYSPWRRTDIADDIDDSSARLACYRSGASF
jgi:hypothetical protein